MRNKIIRLLRWLLSFVELPDPRLARVKELVVWAETLAVNGERKRNQVLAKLITEFPNARVRDLSLLIEQVIQEF